MINLLRIIAVFLLVALGVVSVFMTLSVIFDWFGIREMEGNYVWFVVYANLVCGIIYLFAAFYLVKGRKRAGQLLSYATGLLVVVSIAFAIYVQVGVVHEEKTIFALFFRTGMTAALAWLSFYILKHRPQTLNS